MFYTAAMIGGFLGSCTVYGVAKGFGNGLTGNVTTIFTSLFRGSFSAALLKLVAAFVYLSSIVLVTWLPKHLPRVNRQVLSLVFSALAGVVLAFMPEDLPSVIGLYPTFFAMGFQWCAFPGIYGFSVSCIFNTNNFRQWTMALTNIYLNKDDSFRPRAKAYGSALLAFHSGVIFMCLLWKTAGAGRYTPLGVIPLCLAGFYCLRRLPRENTRQG